MEKKRKFKLISGEGWPGFVEGRVYDEDCIGAQADSSVLFYATEGPYSEDWVEVTDEQEQQEQQQAMTRDTFIKYRDNCMDWFSFNEVAKVMEVLDWKWPSACFDINDPYVPCESEIREHVRERLNKLFDRRKNEQGVLTKKALEYTGGFWIEIDPVEEHVEIKFIVAEWGSYNN